MVRSAVLAVCALAVAAPLTASARSGFRSSAAPHSYVAPELKRIAERHPNRPLHVIVQSRAGAPGAAALVGTSRGKRLKLVGGVATTVTGSRVLELASRRGVTVTPDAPVVLTSNSKQLWPYASDLDSLWGNGRGNRVPDGPAIAVVDSGVEAPPGTFDRRVVANVDLTSLTPNSPGDGRGHGTFVSAIAAGDARDYAGAAPNAKVVSLDVMDDNGIARTSDVIRAAQWILANKSKYNIRVANFSLHSLAPSNFTKDPLDKAIEKLWFNGVVVVTAAGNYGSAAGPSGVRYAPGNDPFAITVGALDINGTLTSSDDTVAPWSAYGRTYDGFAKPELAAPGRYMIGPIPAGSTLAKLKKLQKIDREYIELSGTSFAAPVVSGAAAQLLARHPEWTPDQVKGALMLTANPLPAAVPLSAGVGSLDAGAAAAVASPPNPNRALDQFLVADPSGDPGPIFDAVSWSDAARSAVSWDDVSWSDSAWNAAAWSVVSWSDVSWSDVSWSDVSWSDVSWADVSWSDAGVVADGALDDFLPGGYPAP